MWMVYLGFLLFFGMHLFSTLLPAARDRLKSRLGEGPFKVMYSLATLAGLVLLVQAYRRSDTIAGLQGNFYEPWAAGRHVVMLLVLVAFVLVAASHGKGHIKAWVRHPMSIGVGLWAVAHLLVNGEKSLVWLFGTVLAVAVADLVFSFARGKRPQHVATAASDVRAVVIGLVLYLIFLFGFHPYVLGVPVI